MGPCVSKPLTKDNDGDAHFSKEKLAASNITLVTDVKKWEEKLSEAEEADKIVLVNFSADWCSPCRDVLPVFRSLAEKHTSLMFLIVDVDELAELSTSWDIKATPTFFFLKNGCELDKLVGANKEELRRRTEERSDKNAKPSNQRKTDDKSKTQEVDQPLSERKMDDKATMQKVDQPSSQRRTDD
ncbi:putative monodehydroascorbate reductase (NADH) [Heracleum sosnowskyi]|uniref:Monodehydroascorbate reductase (NADH) n=1 Tax=Heracleum sosnowskyi TaxID=360622 RepID=A0AAD8MC27_9APIA|nr:putative monodehydroascorbate reductase (NADH) [Heracleum sosnowskyi]